jgi:hypothetical protein
LQAMVDGMSAAWQKDRAANQLTLGSLIRALEAFGPKEEIVGLGSLMSYRGYYCDLAFEPESSPRAVEDILADCRAAMGRVFQGYKGGDYLMGETTPLWVAPYGSGGGDRLMGLNAETRPISLYLSPEP